MKTSALVSGFALAAILVSAPAHAGWLDKLKAKQDAKKTSEAAPVRQAQLPPPIAPPPPVATQSASETFTAGGTLSPEEKRDRTSSFNQGLIAERERLEEKLTASGLTEKQKDEARGNLERQLGEKRARFLGELNAA